MSVAAEDVHESFGILDCAVSIARGGLPSWDEAKFTLMCVLCGIVPICVVEAACSLPPLIVGVEALVGVLDDEGISHRNRSWRRETILFFLLVVLGSRCFGSFCHRLARRDLALLRRRIRGCSCQHSPSLERASLLSLVRRIIVCGLVFLSKAALLGGQGFIALFGRDKLLAWYIKYHHVV